MLTVSKSTQRMAARLVGSGGTMRPNRSAICTGASQTQGQITSIEPSAQATASAERSSTA